MFPSRISFWLFGVPLVTVTALKRSNINCGAFLCGGTAGARGKSLRFSTASKLRVTASEPSCIPIVPAPCGIANGVTHPSWRTRTRQRRTAPAAIFQWEWTELYTCRAMGDKGDPVASDNRLSLYSANTGRWLGRDWWWEKKHKGKVKMTRESTLNLKTSKWLIYLYLHEAYSLEANLPCLSESRDMFLNEKKNVTFVESWTYKPIC